MLAKLDEHTEAAAAAISRLVNWAANHANSLRIIAKNEKDATDAGIRAQALMREVAAELMYKMAAEAQGGLDTLLYARSTPTPPAADVGREVERLREERDAAILARDLMASQVDALEAARDAALASNARLRAACEEAVAALERRSEWKNRDIISQLLAALAEGRGECQG